MMLDFNEDRSLQVPSNKANALKSSDKTLNSKTAVKVHISRPYPYINFGGGTYQMTEVRRMTAKKDFLKMPLKDRNCEVELFEDCRTKKLLEECKCKPWDLPGFEVRIQ